MRTMASVRVWSKLLATIVTLFLSLSVGVILILVTVLEAGIGEGSWFLAMVILAAVLAGAVGAMGLIWDSPAEDGENAPGDWNVI
jgi:hypothetical protein